MKYFIFISLLLALVGCSKEADLASVTNLQGLNGAWKSEITSKIVDFDLNNAPIESWPIEVGSYSGSAFGNGSITANGGKDQLLSLSFKDQETDEITKRTLYQISNDSLLISSELFTK